MSAEFIHLRLHTEYSLSDSVIRVPALMDKAVELGMPAVALTDQSNLFALVKFYKAAERRGIKPIIGVDVWIREEDALQPTRLTLLCMDRRGYLNLTALVTRSYLHGQHRGRAMIERDWLSVDRSAGLIALSGAREGDVGQHLLAGRVDAARAALAFWRARFPDRFYIELQRCGHDDEEDYLHAAVGLAASEGLPVVASNDVRFLDESDFGAHEARVCIHDGHLLADTSRPRRYVRGQYFRSAADMAGLFSDIPAALANTVEIARRCNLELRLGESFLPDFPVPEGQPVEQYLRSEAAAGLAMRLRAEWAAEARGRPADRAVYEARLNRELDVICEMGFAGYFLIVADFIRWARENGVPVGPGRGSGAGSLVAYVLGITDIDPLKFDLLFERFLNPERISMPDFDVDFCMEGRDRVIDYVADRYGREKVSQIITYGSMAARAVIRDVGRVLGHPYGYVDRIAKLVPFEIGMTLDKALTQDPELKELYKDDEEVQELIDLARSLEGLARNAGKHAGGVVIAPTELTNFTPLYCEEGGVNVVTQLDKDDVESAGLVKFDFLGLRTLTIIDRALQRVNRQRAEAGESPLDIGRLPMDDPATFALLKRCATTAVFQLESRGMKDLIKRLQPDDFDEIIALVALFRPGPLQSGMVDDFIRRKHDRSERVDYLHPSLEAILKPTYGVILYQEQVMQIAQTLSGYTLGSADLLRRAMGKKKPEEMAKQRSVFLEGATRNGIHERVATRIFDLIEKFAGYGFNKSHSAAYAMLSYQTAWLKAHYPAAFMAAVLSSDMDNTDKVVTLIEECSAMNIKVEPPDVNASDYAFSVSGPSSIRYGLGAIKGVGHAALESLLRERGERGKFADLDDLCHRCDLQRTNRRVLDALLRAGAMDCFGLTRATLSARLPGCVQGAEQMARAQAAGQSDFFGLEELPEKNLARAPAVEEEFPEWSDAQRLAGERDTLGLYLTGHPINQFESDLAYLTNGRLVDLVSAEPAGDRSRGSYNGGRNVTVAGLVLDLRRRGRRISLTLDDRTARIEVSLFEEVFQQHRDIVAKDAILVVEGRLAYDDFIGGWRVTAKHIMDIDQAREKYAGHIVLCWPEGESGGVFVDQLKSALQPFRNGTCHIAVQYRGEGAQARLTLGDEWSVRPTRDLIARLQELVGRDGMRIVYPPRQASGGDL